MIRIIIRNEVAPHTASATSFGCYLLMSVNYGYGLVSLVFCTTNPKIDRDENLLCRNICFVWFIGILSLSTFFFHFRECFVNL